MKFLRILERAWNSHAEEGRSCQECSVMTAISVFGIFATASVHTKKSEGQSCERIPHRAATFARKAALQLTFPAGALTNRRTVAQRPGRRREAAAPASARRGGCRAIKARFGFRGLIVQTSAVTSATTIAYRFRVDHHSRHSCNASAPSHPIASAGMQIRGGISVRKSSNCRLLQLWTNARRPHRLERVRRGSTRAARRRWPRPGAACSRPGRRSPPRS